VFERAKTVRALVRAATVIGGTLLTYTEYECCQDHAAKFNTLCEQERNMHLGGISAAAVIVAKSPKHIMEIWILRIGVRLFVPVYNGVEDSPRNCTKIVHILYTWEFATNKMVHMMERKKVGQHRA
jgi:hypothetical protein